MPRPLKVRPLYREIVRDALRFAWREKRLWPFAIIAALIQMGGIYDTVLLRIHSLTEQAQTLANPNGLPFLWQQFVQGLFLEKIMLLQGLTLAIIVILGMSLFSIIAQGVLVLGIDTHEAKSRLPLRALIQHVAHRIVSLTTINMIGVGATWVIGFFTLTPLLQSLHAPSLFNVFAYLSLFALFIFSVIVFTSWHMLAVNALLVDELTFAEAFSHAWRLLRHSWLTILETAILLMITAAAVYIGTVLFLFIANIPAFLLLFGSIVFVLPQAMFWITLLIATTFFVSLILAGTFTITFQYATWNRLYRRIQEGTAHAKTHRFVHWVSGHIASTRSS
ncbi:hypothetical protein KBA73_01345 [Patescibacteria group bacterium]|nr:hypothetical protein [Patescibacteria group bacterium]